MAYQCTGGGGGQSGLGLARTFDPKYTHYTSDGMGRDTYIIKHNGGLCNEREPNFQVSTRYQSPAKFAYVPAPKKEASSLRYMSDGSGRDSYILINSGGNHVETLHGGKQPFHKSLRQESFIKPVLPSSRDNSRKRDFYYWQNWYLPNHQDSFRKSISYQRNLTDRLNTPKFTRKRSLAPQATVARSLQKLNPKQLNQSFQDQGTKKGEQIQLKPAQIEVKVSESQRMIKINKSSDQRLSFTKRFSTPNSHSRRYFLNSQSQQDTQMNTNENTVVFNKNELKGTYEETVKQPVTAQNESTVKAQPGKHYRKSLHLLKKQIQKLGQSVNSLEQTQVTKDATVEEKKDLSNAVVLKNLKEMIRQRKSHTTQKMTRRNSITAET